MGKDKVFDLASLDTRKKAEAGAVLDVLHPETGKPIGLKITLAGADSDVYVKTQNKLAAARASIGLTPANMKRMRQGRPLEVTPTDLEDQEADKITLYAKITLAWETEWVLDGKPWPSCNPENAAMVYTRFPWMKEQVENFVSERSNFLAG